MVENIDWNFIREKEGFELGGYVPDKNKSKSGVTIASGFDLGQRNEGDLQGLPPTIIQKLTPYLGIKGEEANKKASNLTITEDEANIINEFVKTKSLNKLSSDWENATGYSLSELSDAQATTLASVAFQYGDMKSKTPKFWKYATSGNWDKAYNELMDFKDKYPTRRKSEADLLFKERGVHSDSMLGEAMQLSDNNINTIREGY